MDVNWGDGTPDTTFSVPGDSADNVSLGTQPHTYSQAGTENPTVTVTNSAGLSDSATFQVNVSYVPPSLLPSVTTSVSSVPEGGVGNQLVTYTYTVTNTSQASDDAVTISEIGDNSGSLLTAFEAANGGSATIPYGGAVTFSASETAPVQNAYTTYTNTLNVSGAVDESPVTAGTTATISYTDVLPSLSAAAAAAARRASQKVVWAASP